MADKPGNAPTQQQVNDAQHLDNMTSLQQPSAAEQSPITQNGEVRGDAPVSAPPTPSPDNPSLFNEPKNPNNKVVQVESQKTTEFLEEGGISDTPSDQGSKFTEDLKGLSGDAINLNVTVDANNQGTPGDKPPELDPGVNKAGGNSGNQGPTGGGGIPRPGQAPAGTPTASPASPTSQPNNPTQTVEPPRNVETAPPPPSPPAPPAPNPVTPQPLFVPEQAKVNAPSILAPDSQTIAEDSTAVGNVLTNDSDEDSVLEVTSFSLNGATFIPGQIAVITGVGTVTIAKDGAYLFTPEPNWNGVVPTIDYATNTQKQSTLNIIVTPVDDPVVVVNLSATPIVNEGVANGITYTATLTGGVAQNDIVVTLANGESITIPAGQTSGSVSIDSPTDDIYIDTSTISNSIASVVEQGDAVKLEVLRVVTDSSVNTIVADTEDTVTLKVVACDINGNNFSSTNSGAESATLYYKVVAYAPDNTTIVTGLNGTDVGVRFTNTSPTTSADYTPSATTVKVGDIFNAALLDDYLQDSGEQYTVSLTGAVPTQSTYEKVVFSTDVVTSTITDELVPGTEDTVYVQLYTNDSVTEATGVTLDHTLTLVDKSGNAVNLAAGKQLIVNLSYSSDGTSNADFSTKQTSVTITGDGGNTYTFANTVLDDFLAEGTESYTVTISGVTDVTSGFEKLAIDTGNKSATGTIVDNDSALISDISIWKTGKVYNDSSLENVDDNNQVDSSNDYVQYTVIIKNTGNNTLTGIKLTDEKFPDHDCDYTLQVGIYDATTGTFTKSGSTISGSISNSELSLDGSLLAGKALKLVYVYNVISDDLYSTTIRNTVQVDTAQTDPEYKDIPTLANDGIATYEIVVEKAINDVAIRKFADVHTATLGQTVNYKLIVTNEGTTNLTGVKISDKMLATAGDVDDAASGKQISGYIYTNGIKSLTATNFTIDGSGNLVIGGLNSNQFVEINYSHTVIASDYSVVSTGLVESIFDYTGVSKGPYNPDGNSATADPITMSYGTFSAYVNKTTTDPYATGGTAANIFINTDNTGVAIGVNAGVMSGDRNYNSDHLKAVFDPSSLNGGKALVEKASIVFTNAKDVEVAFKSGYGTSGKVFTGSITVSNDGVVSLREVVDGVFTSLPSPTKSGSTTTFTNGQVSFSVSEASGPGGAQNKLYTLAFKPGSEFVNDFDFWVVGDPTDNSSDQIKVVDVLFDTIDFSITNVTNTAIVTSTEDTATEQSDEIATVDIAILSNLSGTAAQFLGELTTETNLVADSNEAVISSSSGQINLNYSSSTKILGIQLQKLVITDADNIPSTVTKFEYALEIGGSFINSQSVSSSEVTFNLSGVKSGSKTGIFHVYALDNSGGMTEFKSSGVVVDTSKNINNLKLEYTSFTNVAPIALDLNGNGVSYLSQEAGVTFDYNHDGVAESNAWVASEDGLLALQRSDGTHNIVFSTQAGETDLQGLAKVYDTNFDKVLDAQDAGFNNFGVWQDANSDGIVQEGEFKSLSDRGIISLSLTSDGVIDMAADGDVTIYGQTTYTMTDGSIGIAEDVAFAVSSVVTDGDGIQDTYQIASVADAPIVVDHFSADDRDRIDLSSILNPTNSVQSTIAIDADGSTSTHSIITVNIGGVDYEVATLYGKEIGVADALGAHPGGASLTDSLNGASWTDVVDISSEHGGPASIFAEGGSLTNSYSNEAGDWTVQIKSGTATVDAANKQITFSSDNAENLAIITTADGTSHEIANVDKILWH